MSQTHLIRTIVLMIVIVFLAVVGVTVDFEKPDISRSEQPTERVKIDGAYFNVVEFDGCEYLVRTHIDEAAITHKGNCKNKIHQNVNN